jgi:hypothetical protein
LTYDVGGMKQESLKKKQGASGYLVSAFFLTGIFIVLSLPLVGDGKQSLRFLDILGVISLFYLLYATFHQTLKPSQWLAFFMFGISFLLVFISAIYDSDIGRLNILVRLVLSIATGIFLALQAVKHSQIKVLALGVWCGAFLACLLAYGQMVGINALIELAPVDRVESAIKGVVRPQAIWGHPNAAGQVTMAGAALIIVAWKRQSRIILLPVLMYASIPGLNYLIMQNRGPLVVGLLICLLMTVQHSRVYLRISALFFVGCLAVVLMLEPQILIGERWTATFSGLSTSDQAVERFQSTLAGLAIAFEAPFGHALAEREARMLAETGLRVSHNGYVHAFLVLGPWLSGAMLAMLLITVLAVKRHHSQRRYNLALASVCAMLLFEDAIFEPTISTLLVLISSLAYVEKRTLGALYDRSGSTLVGGGP